VYRGKCGDLFLNDMISLPLVYTQVVYRILFSLFYRIVRVKSSYSYDLLL